ncbi:MAG: methyl-accepting chemotaxis protein [Treponema sp.]|nr:methyl-accepting chemotaxis protein [Treponema sp.]
MNLRFKLTSIILAMIMTILVSLSVFTLTRSASLQTATTHKYAMELARSEAIEVQRRLEVFVDYAHILAQILGEYDTIPEPLRRENYNHILYSIMQRNPQILGIWTAWLPGTLDNFDAELGQFQAFFTRQNGALEKVAAGYEGWQNRLANITGKPSIPPPIWRNVAGLGSTPIIEILYPIQNDDTGQFVGLVGLSYISDMDDIVAEIREKVYDGMGVAGIITCDGTILAHFDKARVSSNFATNPTERELLGDRHAMVLQAILSGGENWDPIAMNRHSRALDTDVHIIYHPILISGMDNAWTLMMAIPNEEITRPVREMLFITIIFTVFVLVAAVVITFIIARNITRPIVAVADTLKDISQGEGDLTRRIATNSNDEIGDLSRYFNLTLEKIKNLIVVIKKEMVHLSDIGGDLASNMNQTAASVNQITANIQSIKGRIINQSASVSETHATMEQVVNNINKLNSHVDNQNTHITQASASIEEMVANTNSVTRTLVNNAENVKDLKDASEIGRVGLQGVATDIQEIAKESEGLMEINSLMKNIASQTNLLSMNAAIEAAHAGDAGKGFAVVADEIRKLAESSGEQSKTVGDVLKKIKESIDKISISTGNVLNRFEAIDLAIRTVAKQEDEIRGAMEEQGIGSQQLLKGIGGVNEITRAVTSGSHEMLEGSTEVIQESQKLEQVTQDIAMGMNEMAAGAEQINIAVNHVNDLSYKNREGIDSLVKEVSRFKVD